MATVYTNETSGITFTVPDAFTAEDVSEDDLILLLNGWFCVLQAVVSDVHELTKAVQDSLGMLLAGIVIPGLGMPADDRRLPIVPLSPFGPCPGGVERIYCWQGGVCR